MFEKAARNCVVVANAACQIRKRRLGAHADMAAMKISTSWVSVYTFHWAAMRQ
jgi:hypothetical protein